MDYRREIDGLRALAVIPVILFHAGFETFSGGFVGVDVFFVISGYLITSIIITEQQIGTFKIINFYERRARRILPALFVVMFACLPFAWLWLLPQDMNGFSQSLIAVPVFASNFLFWQSSGYFETASELRPLLHTWSLAVEEQYYLLFPIFLMLTWRFGRGWVLLMLATVAIVSLAAAQWGSAASSAATFYLLPTRGWELILGAFVAFYVSSHTQLTIAKSGSQTGSVIGLLLLTYAIFVFDKTTPTPGLFTLIPTFGTVLIILFATQKTLVGRLLGTRLFVGLGLISYSAYLWHQPLFAFAKHGSPDEPSQLYLSALAIVCVLLAYFTWKYIEIPFRDRRLFSQKAIFVNAAVVSILFMAVGFAGLFNDGFENRRTREQRVISSYSSYKFADVYSKNTCYMATEKTYNDFSHDCYNDDNSRQKLVLWGDSYAAALSYGLKKHYKNTIQLTAAYCPPVLNVSINGSPNCLEINTFVLGELGRLKPSFLVLHANWRSHFGYLTLLDFEKTILAVKSASPKTKIFVIGAVPYWSPTLPIYALQKKATLSGSKYLPVSGYGGLKVIDESLGLMSDKHSVTFVSALDKLCIEDKCLAITKHDEKFELSSWDDGHLTAAGSMFLAEKIMADRMIGD